MQLIQNLGRKKFFFTEFFFFSYVEYDNLLFYFLPLGNGVAVGQSHQEWNTGSEAVILCTVMLFIVDIHLLTDLVT